MSLLHLPNIYSFVQLGAQHCKCEVFGRLKMLSTKFRPSLMFIFRLVLRASIRRWMIEVQFGDAAEPVIQCIERDSMADRGGRENQVHVCQGVACKH